MGVFDTVKFNCPVCGNSLTKQTKAGKCILTTYTLNQLKEEQQFDILKDLHNRKVYCEECKNNIRIDVSIPGDICIILEKEIEGE